MYDSDSDSDTGDDSDSDNGTCSKDDPDTEADASRFELDDPKAHSDSSDSDSAEHKRKANGNDSQRSSSEEIADAIAAGDSVDRDASTVDHGAARGSSCSTTAARARRSPPVSVHGTEAQHFLGVACTVVGSLMLPALQSVLLQSEARLEPLGPPGVAILHSFPLCHLQFLATPPPLRYLSLRQLPPAGRLRVLRTIVAIVLADAAEVTEATKDVLNAAVENDALWPSKAWQGVAVRARAKGRAAPL